MFRFLSKRIFIYPSAPRNLVKTLRKIDPFWKIPMASEMHPIVTGSASQSGRKIELNCTPSSSLVDEQVKITIQGLQPGENVTLRARLCGELGDRYNSFAHFVANCEGDVCVSSDPSVGGFYQGVDPMGIIWSLKLEAGQRKGLRLMKRDVSTPYKVDLAAFQGHLINCDSPEQELCSTTFEKWYIGNGVRRIPVRAGRIRATLFLPPGNKQFPGVIDMLGSAGGLIEYKASLLACRGFAVLALAYFAYEDLPKKPEDVELEYIIEAKEWLEQHPQVLPGGIGVMGVSKGSDIAILLASNSTGITALVCISPCHVLCYSPMKYKGQQLNYLPCNGPSVEIDDDSGLIMRHAYPDNWEGDIKDNPYMFSVENIQCPMLLIYGCDDLCTNAELSVQKIVQRMESFGKGAQCSILHYEGAGHLIEPPYSPLCSMSYHRMFRLYFSWGGKRKEHAFAQEDSWTKIQEFFQQNLPNGLKSNL